MSKQLTSVLDVDKIVFKYSVAARYIKMLLRKFGEDYILTEQQQQRISDYTAF